MQHIWVRNLYTVLMEGRRGSIPAARCMRGLEDNTGVLISLQPDQEGNKLMFLSEWHEFPPAPCLAGKET